MSSLGNQWLWSRVIGQIFFRFCGQKNWIRNYQTKRVVSWEVPELAFSDVMQTTKSCFRFCSFWLLKNEEYSDHETFPFNRTRGMFFVFALNKTPRSTVVSVSFVERMLNETKEKDILHTSLRFSRKIGSSKPQTEFYSKAKYSFYVTWHVSYIFASRANNCCGTSLFFQKSKRLQLKWVIECWQGWAFSHCFLWLNMGKLVVGYCRKLRGCWGICSHYGNLTEGSPPGIHILVWIFLHFPMSLFAVQQIQGTRYKVQESGVSVSQVLKLFRFSGWEKWVVFCALSFVGNSCLTTSVAA